MSAFPHQVIIRNARQHNLKGITVELPRRALTVITGPSGSGKSSLAFDTLYAEGQRRYIESLSTYAKQFLERMPKPLVDSIDGISPAVAIEQKNPTTTSRSTVGTATEIYDFLRLLWARVGTPYCVKCGREVKADTVLVVVDRVAASAASRGRLTDAVATAFSEGEGVAVTLDNGDRRRFSEHPTCSSCGTPAPALAPSFFSFNNPRGACPACNGFGAVLEYDESLIVPDARRTLAQGALDPWTKPRYEGRRRLLREIARAKGIATDTPWRDLPERDRRLLLHGATGRYLGMFPFLERLEAKRYKQYIRVFLRQYQLAKTCPPCGGPRLTPEALARRRRGNSIAQAAALTARELADWIAALTPPAFQSAVAVHILAELAARLAFVNDVGLAYLTLDRLPPTLAGGEAQRIALSNALGSHLVDTLYVLDEPSIGLHPADIDRLLGL